MARRRKLNWQLRLNKIEKKSFSIEQKINKRIKDRINYLEQNRSLKDFPYGHTTT